jgi:hypothetical protein
MAGSPSGRLPCRLQTRHAGSVLFATVLQCQCVGELDVGEWGQRRFDLRDHPADNDQVCALCVRVRWMTGSSNVLRQIQHRGGKQTQGGPAPN